MGDKIVGHYRKIPNLIGLGNVIAHNCRENVYDSKGRPLPEHKLPDYIFHPERAALNEGDRCGSTAILKRRTEYLNSLDLPRKIQGNASVAIEGTYSASAPWFKKHDDPKEWTNFFKDIRDLLAKRFGEENMLHWSVHYDELTPHMHVVFIPLTHNQQRKPTKLEREADPKCMTQYVQSKELRYSSSNFLGGKPGLEMLQDELYEQIGKARGLERGERGSLARHTNQHEWAAKNARDREELDRKEKELATRAAALELKEQELAKREAEAASIKELHERALSILQVKNSSAVKQAQQFEKLRTRLKYVNDIIRHENFGELKKYREALLEEDREAKKERGNDGLSY